MFKILKFGKKMWHIMLLILILLFIGTQCDLALPTYVSNIVDVGIQYKGVEHPVPEQIGKESYERVKLFLSEKEAKIVDEYFRVDDSKNIYVIDQVLDDEDMNRLKEAMLTAEIIVYMLTSDNEEIVQQREQMMQALMTGNAGDVEQQEDVEQQKDMEQQKDIDIFSILEQMPQEAFQALKQSMIEQMGAMPDFMKEASAISFVQEEYGRIGIDLNKYQMDYMKHVGWIMLGIAIVGMIVSIIVGFLASRMGAKIGQELREQIFEKVISFSNAEMNQFSAASLITRSTNDVQQVQMTLTMIFRVVAIAPLMGIGAIIKVLRTNLEMSWVIVIGVAAVMILVMTLMLVAMPKFKIMQKLVDKLNLVSREILTGLSVIRAFSREAYEKDRFADASTELMKTQLFTNRAMALMMPTMMFIMNGIAVLIIWVGADKIDTGSLQVGEMMAFITYTMHVVMSFLMISMIAIMLPRAAVAADRINEVLNSETLIHDPEEVKVLPEHTSGTICFDDVSFMYPHAKENVLDHITFTAKPGETTAIIGSTGCGKSTLVHLIPRLFDVTEGKITIDGIDLRDMKMKELRKMIGFVPQKGTLFSGTIASNIRFGAIDTSDEEMKSAAEIAQAAEFIDAKKEGYESEIAQGGNNVSGGQKQRLAIARAIAKKPKIYIFDDSFSALDYKTDVALRKALAEQVKDATVMIVAQRISTILNADKILVLDDGKIVGIGTHEELLADNEVYQQIASSQLSKEELERKG